MNDHADHTATRLYPLTPMQAEMIACFDLLDSEQEEFIIRLLASMVPHGCRKLNSSPRISLVK